MPYGLSDSDLDTITNSAAHHPEIEEIIIFGSRAMGNFRTGSDVDLGVRGENVTYRTVSSLRTELNEESLLPYKFDVLDASNLSNKELADHIRSFGRILWKR